jgi:hypothetical protein
VVKTLSEVGSSKLLRREQERIRDAADDLIFADTLSVDEAAEAALRDIECLCLDLVESGRWDRDRAMRLADDVYSCGPHLSPESLVA